MSLIKEPQGLKSQLLCCSEILSMKQLYECEKSSYWKRLTITRLYKERENQSEVGKKYLVLCGVNGKDPQDKCLELRK